MGLPEHKLAHSSSQAGLAWVSGGTIDILVGSVVFSHRTNQDSQDQFQEQTQPQPGYGQTDRLLCSVGPCKELAEAEFSSHLGCPNSFPVAKLGLQPLNLLTVASSYLLFPSQNYEHDQSNTIEVIIHPNPLLGQF